jgi:hypothetical protein
VSCAAKSLTEVRCSYNDPDVPGNPTVRRRWRQAGASLGVVGGAPLWTCHMRTGAARAGWARATD